MSVWPLAFARARWAMLLSGLVAVLGFMLPGCSTLRSEDENPPPITAVCHGAQCKVWVVVDCKAPSGCEIASPSTDDNLDMNGFQEVVWEIVSNTGQPYTFKNPGGIFFKDAEVQGLIPCHPEGSLGTRFRCHSKTKNGKAYKYSIQLNGTPPLTVDPWIVNR